MIRFLFKKTFPVIFLLLLTTRAPAPGLPVIYVFASEPVQIFDRLIKAVVQIESQGNTLAYNMTEEAVGAFQIRPIRLRDYNQRTLNNFKMEDCYYYEFSKRIFLYYAILTEFPDYETIARNWNGSGRTTLDYWKKVKSHL